MSEVKGRRHGSGGRTWLLRLSGMILAVSGALAASLVPTSVGARPSAGNGDTIERRIQAVREAAGAADVKPGEEDATQVAQWRNWPNWPNWGNYWNNWPNW